MTFLPVVARELRVAARLRGTHWVRLGAALIALAIGGWIMLIPPLRNTPGALGPALFGSMAFVANVYAALVGLLRTADCLSEEKREGTLGLLFLTDLKGYDIVFGKLVATSLNTFYGMLAVFPILAISLLVGGVTGSEFWRMALVSVNNLLFSLALGMFCSAILRDERKAVATALLLLLFFTIGLPVLGELWRSWNGSRYNPVFGILSPGYATIAAFDKNFSSSGFVNMFYPTVGAIHALTWLLLLLSCVIVPRTWQDKSNPEIASGAGSIWRDLLYGSRRGRAQLRRRLLERNPFHWLTNRERMKSLVLWAFLAFIGLLWMFGLAWNPNDWQDTQAYFWTAFLSHIVVKFWLAAEACRRLCLDRQSGALELLLATPMTVQEILHGQLVSLRRQFAGPAAVLIFSDVLFMASEHDSEWKMTCVAWMVMFVADLITLSWVSMWMGLNSRSTTRAARASIIRIMCLPWLAFLALLTLSFLSRSLQQIMPRGMDFKMLICAWMLLGLLNNVFFGLWAARKLQTEFRQAATQRFETRVRSQVVAPAAAEPPRIAQALPL